MAQKKMTQAQKATAAKNGNGHPKKETEANKAVVRMHNDTAPIAGRALGALLSVILFFLFLVIAMGQEGFLLEFLRQVVQGLFGVAAFYVSIPFLVYLFIILVFTPKGGPV